MGPSGRSAQARIQLAHPGQQAVGLRRHLMVVMDDQPGDPAREAVSEFRHRSAAPLVQDIDAAIQVHHGQARIGGHEAAERNQADPAYRRTPRRPRPSGRSGAQPV